MAAAFLFWNSKKSEVGDLSSSSGKKSASKGVAAMSGGLVVERVESGSPAERAGIRSGDLIRSINGNPVADSIDYMFYRDESELKLVLTRGRGSKTLLIENEEGEDLGIVPGDFNVRSCGNNCVFCFVSQQPKGLRRPLYLKDDDYRMSFLYGNYITLTNLSVDDKERIVKQRISPIYVSVHTTNKELRNRMLGNPRAQDVMKELQYFKKHRIRFHTQIVLCPDYNDGKELERTITDLYSLHPYLLSIAVVPVGLTSHRRAKLIPVDKAAAEAALDTIEALKRRFMRKHGEAIVYGADELYIKAGRAFPQLKEYGELQQLENGVGMVPLFLDQARRLRVQPIEQGGGPRNLTFTGVSFYPYLEKFAQRLRKKGYNIDVAEITNRFFGSSVSVAGLLTGRDVIYALAERASGYDRLIIPDVVLREADEMLLDDVSVAELGKALGIETMVIETTPEALAHAAMAPVGRG